MAIEIEKKYRLSDQQIVEAIDRLRSAGGIYIGERFEENVLFSSEQLLADGAYLRVRTFDGNTELTYKRQLSDIKDDGLKKQLELNVEVNDSDTLKEIIEHLGLEKRLIYEKRRKIWKFGATEVVFDELPFGKYMEIEGLPEDILTAESVIFDSVPDAEIQSYPVLTKHFGIRHGNVTMAVFGEVSV